jgi:YjbE family integral membrane protein
MTGRVVVAADRQYEASAFGLSGDNTTPAGQDLRGGRIRADSKVSVRQARVSSKSRNGSAGFERLASGALPMEFLSPAWLSALAAIILIDLVLAGDNAIVIALAARRLPTELQRRAIIWGTVGAIAVRAAMTVGVVWLLKLPGLMLVGGLGLVWIAYRLLAPPSEGQDEHGGPAASTFWGAMRTIVIADALMGVDNVLGVAGAAHGSLELVIIGLAISVPIVVWGSTLVLRWVERFPAITYIGAGVLAYTAGHMIVSEPLLDAVYDPHLPARLATYAVLIAGVLGAGWWATRRMHGARDHAQLAA